MTTSRQAPGLIPALCLALVMLAAGSLWRDAALRSDAAYRTASVFAESIGGRVDVSEAPSIEDLREELARVVAVEQGIESVAVMCATGPMSGSIVAEVLRGGGGRSLATPVDLTSSPAVREGFAGARGRFTSGELANAVAPAGPACAAVVGVVQPSWLSAYGVGALLAALAGSGGLVVAAGARWRGSAHGPPPARAPAAEGSNLAGALGARFAHLARRAEDRRLIAAGPLVPPDVFSDLVAVLGSDVERAEVTVVRGVLDLSALEATLAPAEVVAMFDTLLEEVASSAGAWEGTLVHTPDTTWVAVFGAPIEARNHADRAARCALEMRDRFARVTREWSKTRSFEGGGAALRMSVSTGYAVCAHAGPASQRVWSVFGEVLRVAERLDRVAVALGCDLVVAGPTVDRFDGPVPSWATGQRVDMGGGSVEVHAVGVQVDTPAPLRRTSAG